MSDQLAIDGTGVPTPPEVKLTERQRDALEKIAADGPITSDDLGAHLNPRFPNSPWNAGNGAATGHRLRALGLVRYSRNHGGWVLKNWKDGAKTTSGYDPSTAEIPF